MSLDAALKVLADPTRMKILAFLRDPIEAACSREDGVCACDLEDFLGMSQPTISHHMKQLVTAGFVEADRRGRWTYYELQSQRFAEIASALQAFAEVDGRGTATPKASMVDA